MEKVVHLSKIFKTIFYFKFLELRKAILGLVKVWSNLKSFELNRIWFLFLWIQIPHPVTVPRPHLAAPPPPLFWRQSHATREHRCRPHCTARSPRWPPRPSPLLAVVWHLPRTVPPPPRCARLKGCPITTAPPLFLPLPFFFFTGHVSAPLPFSPRPHVRARRPDHRQPQRLRTAVPPFPSPRWDRPTCSLFPWPGSPSLPPPPHLAAGAAWGHNRSSEHRRVGGRRRLKHLLHLTDAGMPRWAPQPLLLPSATATAPLWFPCRSRYT
jgi:hypothetical protein